MPEPIIKDIIAVRPNLGGGAVIANFSSAGKEMSILACPCTPAEIERIKNHEEIVWVSHDNQRLAKALKLNETKRQDTAKNYNELELNLAYYFSVACAVWD